MRNFKSLNTYRLMLIICSLLFVALFTMDIVILFNSDLMGEATQAVGLIFFLLTFNMAFGTVFSAMAYFNQVHFIRNLRVENSYTLGRPSTIFNLEAFKNKVESLRKSRRFRNYEQYVVPDT